MSKGVNKWHGIGNLTADPEVKSLQNGNAVTNFSIACNNSYKDKNTGQIVEAPEFIRIVFFNRLAEIAGEYLRKGSKVYVEGALRTRKWQDQSGQDRYTTEIVGSEMQMLDTRSGGGDKAEQQAAAYGNQPQQRQPQQQRQQTPQQAPQPSQDDPDFFEDDIPF